MLKASLEGKVGKEMPYSEEEFDRHWLVVIDTLEAGKEIRWVAKGRKLSATEKEAAEKAKTEKEKADADKSKAAYEEAAALKLKTAKKFLDQFGEEAAIEKLEELLKKWPNSKAAEEARQMLENLRKPKK